MPVQLTRKGLIRSVERIYKESKRKSNDPRCDDDECPGWAVFNDDEIQRCDECDKFIDDLAAAYGVLHVAKRKDERAAALLQLDIDRVERSYRVRGRIDVAATAVSALADLQDPPDFAPDTLRAVAAFLRAYADGDGDAITDLADAMKGIAGR